MAVLNWKSMLHQRTNGDCDYGGKDSFSKLSPTFNIGALLWRHAHILASGSVCLVSYIVHYSATFIVAKIAGILTGVNLNEAAPMD